MIEKKTGHFKSFDGTRIYYEIRGKGRPLVFCYGIGCLFNHWQHQIKYFSRDYQTILFDYRAHHGSEIPKDRSELTIDAIARDIKELMDHLEIQNACFVGHSFGVQVLVRAIDIFPEFFKLLVFINGFAHNPIKGMFGTEAATYLFEAVKRTYDLLPETTSHLWKKAGSNPLSVQAMALTGGFNLNLSHLKDVEIYLRGMGTIDLDSFMNLFEQMMGYDGRSVFERIDAPTLIVSGDKDSVTPESYQIEMHEKIKNSQYLKVPYGSHCSQLDMPEYVNLRVEKFLKSNSYS